MGCLEELQKVAVSTESPGISIGGERLKYVRCVGFEGAHTSQRHLSFWRLRHRVEQHLCTHIGIVISMTRIYV